MKFPDPVAKGPKWLRKAFAERDAYTQSITPIAGAGISLIESDSGTSVSTTTAGVVSVTSVTWDSVVGQLVIGFSNGVSQNISTALCPPPP